MNEELIFQSPVNKMYFNSNLKAIVSIWDGKPTAEQFIEVVSNQAKFVKQKSVSSLVADGRNLGPVPKEGQDWVNNIGWKQLVNSGLKKIAIIIPDSALAQLSVEKMTEETEGVISKYFKDIEEATPWLKQ